MNSKSTEEVFQLSIFLLLLPPLLLAMVLLSRMLTMVLLVVSILLMLRLLQAVQPLLLHHPPGQDRQHESHLRKFVEICKKKLNFTFESNFGRVCVDQTQPGPDHGPDLPTSLPSRLEQLLRVADDLLEGHLPLHVVLLRPPASCRARSC